MDNKKEQHSTAQHGTANTARPRQVAWQGTTRLGMTHKAKQRHGTARRARHSAAEHVRESAG